MTTTPIRLLLGVAAMALAAGGTPLAAQGTPDFSWEGRVPAGRWLFVRNLNGSIRVDRATGDKARVTAVKRVRRGSGDDVRIEVKPLANDEFLICAIWFENTDCTESGYRTRGNREWNRRNDVSVEFTVQLPEGVRLVSSSVNGAIDIRGATSEIDASTVNGGITAASTGGPVHASTVNGSIDVRMGDAGSHDLSFETVNGSIELELPASLDAELDMRTVNGRVSSDFPLTIQGRINPRHIRAVVGKGGRRVKVATVNGSIDIRRR